jgi:hypothetical protein
MNCAVFVIGFGIKLSNKHLIFLSKGTPKGVRNRIRVGGLGSRFYESD